ncbi:MAG: hypothetical protein KDK41_16065 [Leptospiraceae bacterium]|nr:hypothetical protein [Leptospiraceae bacterium]
MNREQLKIEFQKGGRGLEFNYDENIVGWGLSHYRFTKGEKVIFQSIEEFFKEVMLYSYLGKSGPNHIWDISQKSGIIEYVNGLNISEIDRENFKVKLEKFRFEVLESKEIYNDEEEFDLSVLELPENLYKIFSIKETISPRFYINTYNGLLAETESAYYFYEHQFES